MPNLHYTLDKLPVGLVMLDAEGSVVSFSGVAAEILGRGNVDDSLGKPLAAFHPPHAQSMIDWLLFRSREEGSRYASMLIHVPDTIVQVRVVRMWRGEELSGFCVVMYDVTEVASVESGESAPASGAVTEAAEGEPAQQQERKLVKIPVAEGGSIALVDNHLVVCIQAKGHYTQVSTANRSLFCSMSIGQLEARLPAEQFLRVHRGFIVNLAYAAKVIKRDDQYLVVMTDQREIPVARSKVSHLRELFGV